MQVFDVIVVGTGGVGSAALYELARRGARVLGIDPFPPGHDQGSSHGHTRAIRQAYFEHPDYVPLLRRAYELWTQLESESGQELLFLVGLLEAGLPDGAVIPGVLASAEQHALAVEQFTVAEARRQWPQFHFDDAWQVLFEKNAGYLLVERCVETFHQQASRHGAQFQQAEVRQWQPRDGAIEVTTTDGARYAAAQLVVAGGAWNARLLGEIGVSLTVRKKHLHWFPAAPADGWAKAPVFFFDTGDGFYYGFPQLDTRGVKVAEHTGGEVLTGDPLATPRTPDPADLSRVGQFVRRHLPRLGEVSSDHAVCFYTMSPDDHFIVDRHPAAPQVCFAAGLSGHGFKFVPVLGEMLADWATCGDSKWPSDFLRLTTPSGTRRFGSG